MSNEDDVLRRSLDSVDRTRNRLMTGVSVAALALLAALYQGALAMHSGSTPLLLHAVMLILAVWMTILVLVVIMQMNAMTRRILRAIELASRK